MKHARSFAKREDGGAGPVLTQLKAKGITRPTPKVSRWFCLGGDDRCLRFGVCSAFHHVCVARGGADALGKWRRFNPLGLVFEEEALGHFKGPQIVWFSATRPKRTQDVAKDVCW